MLKVFLWSLEIVVGLLLVLVVLLQVGRRSELGASFGGGAQSVFGPTGPATIFEKATYVLTSLFMIITFAIAKVETSPRIVPLSPQEAPAVIPPEQVEEEKILPPEVLTAPTHPPD